MLTTFLLDIRLCKTFLALEKQERCHNVKRAYNARRRENPGNSATGMEIGIQGSIPTPSLYKGLGTHQRSKKHEIQTILRGVCMSLK